MAAQKVGVTRDRPGGSLSHVGAVYDRAFLPLDCEKCAVIDRAYSRNVSVFVLVPNLHFMCKPARRSYGPD